MNGNKKFFKKKLSTVVQACNLCTLEMWRQEDPEFEASLGYIGR
jgi:hypothetical protein